MPLAPQQAHSLQGGICNNTTMKIQQLRLIITLQNQFLQGQPTTTVYLGR